MSRLLRLTALLGMLSTTTWEAFSAESVSIINIPTPRGVQQPLLLIKPDHAIASVILVAGGNGAIRLDRVPPSRPSAYPLAGNFLVRTREKFAAHDFIVAVVDVPSDQQAGMSPDFRVSKDQVTDIDAVASYLKRQADVPVWLIGTSQGSWSVVRAAIDAGRNGAASRSINGLVLTSAITHISPSSDFAKSFPSLAKEHPDGVISMTLSAIKVPTLIVSHNSDACALTPAADAQTLAKHLTHAANVRVVLLDGGDLPKSDPCEAYSAHGFYGVEAEAVDAIADFISTNGHRSP